MILWVETGAGKKGFVKEDAAWTMRQLEGRYRFVVRMCVDTSCVWNNAKLRSWVFCRLGLLCRPGLLRLCTQMMGFKNEHTGFPHNNSYQFGVFLFFYKKTVRSAHNCTLDDNSATRGLCATIRSLRHNCTRATRMSQSSSCEWLSTSLCL